MKKLMTVLMSVAVLMAFAVTLNAEEKPSPESVWGADMRKLFKLYPEAELTQDLLALLKKTNEDYKKIQLDEFKEDTKELFKRLNYQFVMAEVKVKTGITMINLDARRTRELKNEATTLLKTAKEIYDRSSP